MHCEKPFTRRADYRSGSVTGIENAAILCVECEAAKLARYAEIENDRIAAIDRMVRRIG